MEAGSFSLAYGIMILVVVGMFQVQKLPKGWMFSFWALLYLIYSVARCLSLPL